MLSNRVLQRCQSLQCEIRRGLFASILALVGTIVADQAAYGQDASVITGSVVNDAEQPVESAAVWIEASGTTIGAVTGPDGSFVIGPVPPGSHVIQSSRLGHERDVGFIEIGDADSLHVTLHLERVTFPFGTDKPLPDPSVLSAAWPKIPQLLDEAEFLAVLQDQWPGLTPRDTVFVWVPWSAESAAHTSPGGPTLFLGPECAECLESERRTLDAGPFYVAPFSLIRIGVRGRGAGTPRIEYCVGFLQDGDQLWRNCVGPQTQLRVTYWHRGDEDWVRLD